MHSKVAAMAGILVFTLLAVWAFRTLLWESSPDDGKTPITEEMTGGTAFNGEPPSPEAREIAPRQRIEPGVADPTAGVKEKPETPESGAMEIPYPFLVQGEGGERVAGAEVRLFHPAEGRADQEVICGPSGCAVLCSPRPGDEIDAGAQGYIPRRSTLEDRPWPRPYVIVLEKAVTLLEGIVVDDLERPVEGARISMLHDGGRSQGITARDGSFPLNFRDPPVLPLQVKFSIVHPSFCFLGESVPVRIETMDKRPMLKVHRWARLHVEAVDPDGRPLSGIKATLAGPPETADRTRLPGVANVSIPLGLSSRRAAQDSPPNPIVIEKAPPLLPLWLIVEHPSYESVEMELGRLEPAQERNVIVRFIEPSLKEEAVFRVVDPDGNPVTNADVSLLFDLHGNEACSRTTTDADGVFGFLPTADAYEMYISAAGFAQFRQTYASSRLGRERITVTLEPSAAVIVVHVKDEEGAGVPRVTLMMTEPGNKLFHAAVRTDENGRAEFSGLDAESKYLIQLGFGRPGRYFKDKDRTEVPSPAVFHGVRPGTGGLVFRLVPPASIGGRVQIEGAAHEDATLTLVDAADEERFFAVGAVLGAGGGFLFTGLPPGRYHLWMRSLKSSGRYDRPLAVWDLGAGEKVRNAVVRKNP